MGLLTGSSGARRTEERSGIQSRETCAAGGREILYITSIPFTQEASPRCRETRPLRPCSNMGQARARIPMGLKAVQCSTSSPAPPILPLSKAATISISNPGPPILRLKAAMLNTSSLPQAIISLRRHRITVRRTPSRFSNLLSRHTRRHFLQANPTREARPAIRDIQRPLRAEHRMLGVARDIL